MLPIALAYMSIVFVLVDDMGYADVGAHGNRYHQTPHVDRLAAAGMLFTAGYAAAPNCSPTRASILAGRWPARVGITQSCITTMSAAAQSVTSRRRDPIRVWSLQEIHAGRKAPA